MTSPAAPAAGEVPAAEPIVLRVAPTDIPDDHNAFRPELRPVHAWRVEDVHFAFDSSVILPSMLGDLARLRVMLKHFAGHPITIFGHADTTGNDAYNKQLSGRRAMALYALLTRRTALWEKLFTTPFGGDDWKGRGLVDTVFRAHLEAAGKALPPGAPRAQVFSAYMDDICRDQDGKGFGVNPKAFLGQGADPAGKADFQGCGEFNPVLMFSAEEQRRFALASHRAERDEAGAPNRRVEVYFFRPGTSVQPSKWPCPRALEGTTACHQRFWSDAAARRTFQERRREAPKDDDTYACRFYDRFEQALGRELSTRVLVLQLFNEREEPDADVPFALVAGGMTTTGRTSDQGIIRARIPARARNATLEVHGEPVTITIAPLPPIDSLRGVQVRLFNLGFFGGNADGQDGFELREGVAAFQRAARAEGRDAGAGGDPADPAFQAALLAEHGS